MKGRREKKVPLGHFLNDEKTLLYDLNCLSVANNLLNGNNDGLYTAGTIKVVHTEEIVKIGQGSEATPVIERLGSTGDWKIWWLVRYSFKSKGLVV